MYVVIACIKLGALCINQLFYYTTATNKDIIDCFNHYLTTEMDNNLIVQHMLSQNLLNDQEFCTIKSGMSDYHKNCLILEKIRLMNAQSLVQFCKILQMFDCQKHIANVLLNGKILTLYATIQYIIMSNTLQHYSLLFLP